VRCYEVWECHVSIVSESQHGARAQSNVKVWFSFTTTNRDLSHHSYVSLYCRETLVHVSQNCLMGSVVSCTMYDNTKFYITQRSGWYRCGFLFCNVTWFCRSLIMFLRNVSLPSSWWRWWRHNPDDKDQHFTAVRTSNLRHTKLILQGHFHRRYLHVLSDAPFTNVN
jgi:hypothetical protein